MDARESYRRAVEAFNRGDAEGFAAEYAESATVHDPQYPQPLVGRDAIEQDVIDVQRFMPDARFTIRTLLHSGDTAVLEYGLTGTHLGPLSLPGGEVEATGRHVDMPGTAVAQLDAEGRVIEERRYYDVAGMLEQLGILQVGAHAG
jgi:steroid delta-isomerase-like uncharacterized protein